MLNVRPEPEQVWKDFERWVFKHQKDFVNGIQSSLNYTVWYDLKDEEFFSTSDVGDLKRDFKHDTIKILKNKNHSYWEPSISYKDFLGNYQLAYKHDYVSLNVLEFNDTSLDKQGFKNILENFDYNNTDTNQAIENFIDQNKIEFDTANLHAVLDETPESYFDNGLKDQQIAIIENQLGKNATNK